MNDNIINAECENTNTAKKNTYTTYDTLTALLLLPISFGFVRAAGASDFPMGRFILSLILFSLSAFYLIKHNVKLTAHKFSFLSAIVALIMSFGLISTSNSSLQSLLSSFISMIFLYWVFASGKNSAEKLPSDLFFLEMLKAAIIMPFGSVMAALEAFSGKGRGKLIGKKLLLILGGLTIAFIPALIVFALLSYDESFKELSGKILDFADFDFFRFVSDMILTIPLAFLIFGALYSSKNQRFSSVLNAEKCKKVSGAVRFLDVTFVVSAIFPFVIIYLVFFISQIDYYLSAFSGVLPSGMSYSSYARKGFFELCAVSAINAIIILISSVFTKPGKNGSSLALRIANTLIAISTLVLIATAMSKMVLYIDTYGLTVKRVLSSAFMIFLAIVFLVIIIKQFKKRTNVVLTAILAATLISTVLALADVNTVIASYNTDRYLEGSLEDFEISSLMELGDSGAVQLDRIAEKTKDENVRTEATDLLRLYTKLNSESSIFSMTIPKLRAEKLLTKYSRK